MTHFFLRLLAALHVRSASLRPLLSNPYQLQRRPDAGGAAGLQQQRRRRRPPCRVGPCSLRARQDAAQQRQRTVDEGGAGEGEGWHMRCRLAPPPGAWRQPYWPRPHAEAAAESCWVRAAAARQMSTPFTLVKAAAAAAVIPAPQQPRTRSSCSTTSTAPHHHGSCWSWQRSSSSRAGCSCRPGCA